MYALGIPEYLPEYDQSNNVSYPGTLQYISIHTLGTLRYLPEYDQNNNHSYPGTLDYVIPY